MRSEKSSSREECTESKEMGSDNAATKRIFSQFQPLRWVVSKCNSRGIVVFMNLREAIISTKATEWRGKIPPVLYGWWVISARTAIKIRTMLLTLSLKKEVQSNDYVQNKRSNDESKNDESFSSFLSPSIGSNISKLFDWALETSLIEFRWNPFECYFFPIRFLTTRKQAVTAGHRRRRNGDSVYEVRQSLVSDRDDEDGDERKEDLRPHAPFILLQNCEYCGSPSIRNCQKYDPECQRPETFFKPPFGWSTHPNPLRPY